MIIRTSLAVLCAMAIAGCAGSVTVRATGPTNVRRASLGTVNGAYVAAGTRFAVRLDQPVSSLTSAVGDRFTAHLLEPLYSGGQLVAPAGARLTGRVAQLADGRLPLIRLEFQGVETSQGFTPMQVAVRRAEHTTFEDVSRRERLPPANWGNGYAMHAPEPGGLNFEDVYGPGNGGSYLGNPVYVGHPREVRMDAGARIELQLTRDMVLGR